jgi:hypothetical protein
MIRRTIVLCSLVACTHTGPTPADVPIAFGRWRPPTGQSCYVDAIEPPELPPLSELLDSTAVVSALRSFARGELLITLAFDSSGRTTRTRVIDRRMSAARADSVRATVEAGLRMPRISTAWGARLRVSTGESPSLALARRELCPPALARIEPLTLASLAVTEPELEPLPSPDWVVRGVPPPPPPPRSTVEKTIAGAPQRDTARLTTDSLSTSPDVTALGDDVLTLRVLIDTAGTIAHAEISRAAAAGIDPKRLVTELARYRFHPALEDRVPTPWWVILRIK